MLRNQKILATTTMKTKEFTNDEEEFFPLYSLESFVRQNPIQYSVSISLFNFSICSNNLSAEIRSCVIHTFLVLLRQIKTEQFKVFVFKLK